MIHYLNMDLMVALAEPSDLSYSKLEMSRSMAQPRSSTSCSDVSVSSKAKQRRTKMSKFAARVAVASIINKRVEQYWSEVCAGYEIFYL